MSNTNRRGFIKKTAIAGLGMVSTASGIYSHSNNIKGKRVGVISLDMRHSLALATSLNAPDASDKYGGYKVVAAYPEGTENIEKYIQRIPEITKGMMKLDVEIVDSIEELLQNVDVVLMICVDGNKHLEQALQVFKAGKPVFIDKPLAASISDAYTIIEAAKYYNVPMFSSSSLRYMNGLQEIVYGKIGNILGVDSYSPAVFEEHHTDLFWYGIHGIEILYALMGQGCKNVRRVYTPEMDMIVGCWRDGRIGTFRGIRKGKRGYGATVFAEDEIVYLENSSNLNPLLESIIKFFDTGIPPVANQETFEIFAFMQAAYESKIKNGITIDIESVMDNVQLKEFK